MSDIDRFQTWQRDSLAGREDDADMLSIGPFRALLSTAGDGTATGWVTLIDGTATEADTTKALTKLRATLKKRKVRVLLETGATRVSSIAGLLIAAFAVARWVVAGAPPFSSPPENAPLGTPAPT